MRIGCRQAWLYEVAFFHSGDACLVAPFTPTTGGYVTVKHEGRQTHVHSVVCAHFHGPRPSPRHEAAHRCGKAGCANKNHLRWATPEENHADRLLHGTDARGENHPMHVITATEALMIRDAKGAQKAIAEQFGIGQSAVSDIKLRKTWSHLP